MCIRDSSNTIQKGESENDPDQTTVDYTIDYRIGYEKRIPIKGKFLCYVGIDAVGRALKSKVTTNSPLRNTLSLFKSNEIGLGPIFGIQFNINDRISLSTEGRFTYRHDFELSKTEVGGMFPFSEKEKTSENRLAYDIPTSLFFQVRF